MSGFGPLLLFIRMEYLLGYVAACKGKGKGYFQPLFEIPNTQSPFRQNSRDFSTLGLNG